jgi:hypothetical protein
MKAKTNSVAALLAILASVALAACGEDDDATTAGTTSDGAATTTERTETTPPPKPAIPTIVLRDRAPVGGVQELTFDASDQVRFRVRSDAADEIHVHGYDVSEEVPAGSTASFSFPAEIEGIFEVESHGSGEQIAELRVEP